MKVEFTMKYFFFGIYALIDSNEWYPKFIYAFEIAKDILQLIIVKVSRIVWLFRR